MVVSQPWRKRGGSHTISKLGMKVNYAWVYRTTPCATVMADMYSHPSEHCPRGFHGAGTSIGRCTRMDVHVPQALSLTAANSTLAWPREPSHRSVLLPQLGTEPACVEDSVPEGLHPPRMSPAQAVPSSRLLPPPALCAELTDPGSSPSIDGQWS